MKKILVFLFTFVFSMIGGASLGLAAGIDPIITTSGAMGLSIFMQTQSGTAGMAIQKEIWVNVIIGNLFQDNEFLNYVYNADQYVINGTLVHIPQAGAPSAVKRNRTNLPATITQRQDVDVTYALDEFTTDPRLIVNADSYELSYDKTASVLSEDISNLKEIIANWMLYKWAPAGATRILRTTGVTTASHLPSSTGNRKKLLVADLARAQRLMNKDGVPKTERYCLMSSDMYAQLLLDSTFTANRDVIRDMNLPEGVVNRLYGFNILERANVLVYTNAGTPAVKLPDAVGATTDNDCVLCWQKNSLEKAMGTTDFFEDLKNPQFYGDVYSALQRMGGRIRRQDEKGVVAIVQEP